MSLNDDFDRENNDAPLQTLGGAPSFQRHIHSLVPLHSPKLVHDLQVMGDALIPGGFVGKQIDNPWNAGQRNGLDFYGFLDPQEANSQLLHCEN